MANLRDLIGRDTSERLTASLDSHARSLEAMTKAGVSHTSERLLKEIEKLDSREKTAQLVGLGVSEQMKRTLDSISSQSPKFEALCMNDAGCRALESISSAVKIPKFEALSSNDELRRSLERTSVLALGLDDAISKMRIPDRDFNMLGRVPEAPSLNISEIDFTPNPIFETNSQLAELTAIVTQLVDVAKQQAELTQSIRKTSDLTLTHAVQSGEEAKTATQLARTSVRVAIFAIIASIIGTFTSIGLTVYGNHRQSASSEVRRQEDKRNRQEEVRVLREISSQLNGLSVRATTTIKPQSRLAGKAKQ